MNRKVIIWGHKLHSHTHSYIHNAYYEAFKYMGYDTYWFDKYDNISGFNFENSIFLTEDQAQDGIPLNKSSKYILHHSKLDKYIDNGCDYINLCNYVGPCKDGISFNYSNDEVEYGLEELTYYSFWDEDNKAIYQPWATSVLPNQIPNEPEPFNNNNEIYYVGSITPNNIKYINEFRSSCDNNGKNFINRRRVSEVDAKALITSSYMYPDIRENWHVEVGYVPCRIFKNISYGCIPVTNSEHIRDFFGENSVPYGKPNEMFKVSEAYLSDVNNIEHSKWLINEIKEHHTYVTRIKTLISLLG